MAPETNHGVIAVVPTKDCRLTIAATVQALLDSSDIDCVVVVDDGSHDGTGDIARQCGAKTIRLAVNQGKGAAMAAAAHCYPEAELYLFVDGDTGESAAGALRLIQPVVTDQCDLAIGVLPSAGRRSGFGLIKRLAGVGIAATCGVRTAAPLSGQRAVRGSVLRSLVLAPRFGVEVAMTVDARRRGARVLEISVEMEHSHRGRSLSGFFHRGKQGAAIASALLPRLLGTRGRMALAGGGLVIASSAAFIQSGSEGPPQRPLPRAHVTIQLVPDLDWDDIDRPVEIAGSVVTGVVDDSLSGASIERLKRAAAAGTRDARAIPVEGLDVMVVPTAKGNTDDPHKGLVIVAGVTVNGDPAQRPVFIEGAAERGTLTSASTRRAGLIDISDLAPTALEAQGREVPSTMAGRPIRIEGDTVDAGSLIAASRTAAFYDRWRPGIIAAYVGIQVLGFGAALLLGRRKTGTKSPVSRSRRFHRRAARASAPPPASGRVLPGSERFAQLVASVPLASYLVFWGTKDSPMGIIRWSALMALAMGIICLMSGRAAGGVVAGTTNDTARPLRRIFGATALVMCADLVSGSTLQLGGLFSSSPTLGRRYYGLGNPASVVLLIATLLWAILHVRTSINRRAALFEAGAVFVVAGLLTGLPGVGSDVGGFVAFTVTGILVIATLSGGDSGYRVRWRWLAGAAALGGGSLALLGVFDAARSTGSQTHLGRLVDQIQSGGWTHLIEVVGRKVSANLFGYGFPWTLAIVAAALYLLISLIASNRWTDTLPAHSLGRVGAALALIAGFISFIANDSGIVVLMLVAVFLGPFILVEYRASRYFTPKLEVSQP